MRREKPFSRRQVLTGAVAGGGALALSGCSLDSRSPGVMSILELGRDAEPHRAARSVGAARGAARPNMRAPTFPPISSPTAPPIPTIPLTSRRATRTLSIGGSKSAASSTSRSKLSLADLRAMPPRTQITRHDCVEGWSCIGQWTGAPLREVLDAAGLKPSARYIAFFCADDLGRDMGEEGLYYETIDLIDANHPQTILAYEMNGAPLAVEHGAPLRLRVERQLGYKMAKYVMRVEAIDSFAALGGGRGGFWEDRGYEWYAGI